MKTDHPLVIRHVLGVFGAFACDGCGFAWPGMGHLIENTRLSDRAIQNAAKALIAAGDLKIHAYAKGGRRRVTEYVVLPNSVEKSAPCRFCQSRTIKPTRLYQQNGSGQGDSSDDGWRKRAEELKEQGRRLIAEEEASKTPK